jgi:hypothetical protein
VKILLKATLVALCATSQLSYALDEAVLADYNRQVSAQICKGDTNWLRCYGLDPLTCEGQSEKIIRDCMETHVFSRIQSVRSEAEVHIISQQLYSCIRSSFSQKFDSQKKDSPECKGLE